MTTAKTDTDQVLEQVRFLHRPKMGAFGVTICKQECRDGQGSVIQYPCPTMVTVGEPDDD